MVFISPLALLVSPYQKDEVVVIITAVAPEVSRMSVIGELPKRITAVLHHLPQTDLK